MTNNNRPNSLQGSLTNKGICVFFKNSLLCSNMNLRFRFYNLAALDAMNELPLYMPLPQIILLKSINF